MQNTIQMKFESYRGNDNFDNEGECRSLNRYTTTILPFMHTSLRYIQKKTKME